MPSHTVSERRKNKPKKKLKKGTKRAVKKRSK